MQLRQSRDTPEFREVEIDDQDGSRRLARLKMEFGQVVQDEAAPVRTHHLQ